MWDYLDLLSVHCHCVLPPDYRHWFKCQQDSLSKHSDNPYSRSELAVVLLFMKTDSNLYQEHWSPSHPSHKPSMFALYLSKTTENRKTQSPWTSLSCISTHPYLPWNRYNFKIKCAPGCFSNEINTCLCS